MKATKEDKNEAECGEDTLAETLRRGAEKAKMLFHREAAKNAKGDKN